jgi:type I restriction enzyme S subunit
VTWRVGTIGDLVALQRGHDLVGSEQVPGEVPVVGSAGPNGFHNVAIAKGPGVTIGRSGGSIGRVTYVPTDYWPHNTCIYVTDFKGNHPRFVAYMLGRLNLAQLNSGAAQPSLNRNFVYGVQIRFPDPMQQAEIAAALAAFDDLIEINRRRIQLLDQSARLLYQEWFAHLRFPGHEHVPVENGVPKGWETVPLGTICTDIRDAVKPDKVEASAPYIGLEHIPRRSITLDDWGNAGDVQSQKFQFIEGDILFGKIRPYFHKVGFALNSGITSSDAIVIRALEPHLYTFVLLLMSSDQFVAVASKTVKEGSKMPRADWKFLKSHRVALPPKPLLLELSDICEPILAQLKVLALQSRKLREARDLLLPRLMNGEIAV